MTSLSQFACLPSRGSCTNIRNSPTFLCSETFEINCTPPSSDRAPLMNALIDPPLHWRAKKVFIKHAAGPVMGRQMNSRESKSANSQLFWRFLSRDPNGIARDRLYGRPPVLPCSFSFSPILSPVRPRPPPPALIIYPLEAFLSHADPLKVINY